MKRKKLRLTPKQAEHMLFNVLEIGSRMLVSGAEVQRVEIRSIVCVLHMDRKRPKSSA